MPTNGNVDSIVLPPLTVARGQPSGERSDLKRNALSDILAARSSQGCRLVSSVGRCRYQ